MLLGLFLLIYIVVALCNYSVVQSYIGRYAGIVLSEMSDGGKVAIGSMYVNPLGQVVLREILMVSPTNDTVADAERIAVKFKKNPIQPHGLTFDMVTIKNTYYHLQTYDRATGGGINLNWFIHIFSNGEKHEHNPNAKPYTLNFKKVYLDGVHYKMDLPDHQKYDYEHGVDIPHMEFKNINARFKNVKVVNDNVDCRIVSFYAEEKSGFVLHDMSADVSVGPTHIIADNMELQTDNSRLLFDARLIYTDWKTMQYYCDSVYMTLLLKPGSIGGMADAAYWAPTLWGVDSKITIEGNFYGPVADMHADNVVASFGDISNFSFDGHVVGLPNIKNTYINADVHHLYTTYKDMANIHLPNNAKIPAIDIVKKLQTIQLQAKMDGSFEQCQASVKLKSAIGNINAKGSIAYNTHKKIYEYMGNVNTSSIQLNRLFPNDWISRGGLIAKVSGEGMNLATMKTTIEGEVTHPYVKQNKLSSPSFVAKIEKNIIEANVNLTDSLANLGIQAWVDLSDSLPNYRAYIDMTDCNLTQLHILDSTEEDYLVSTYASADVTGNELNSLTGTINLSNTDFEIGENGLHLDNLEMDILQHNGRKNISMESDWMTMMLTGYFDYENLGMVARHFCENYLPTYYNPFKTDKEIDYAPIADNYFNLDIKWIGSPNQLHALYPKITIAKGTSIHGSYNFTESLKLVGRSDSLKFGPVMLNDLGIRGALLANNYQMNINSEMMGAIGVNLFEQMNLELLTSCENVTIGLQWGDDERDLNHGDVALMMHSTDEMNHIAVLRPTFYMGGKRWSIDCPQGITLCDSLIAVPDMKIHGNNETIMLNAQLAHKHNDQVNIMLDNIQLDRLSKLLLPNFGMTIGGVLTARGSLYGIYQTPYMNANVKIDECSLGNQSLGLVDATTTWNAELNQLNLSLNTLLMREAGNRQPLMADGYIELNDNNPTMDFDVSFDQFNLDVISPLTTSFSSKIGGQISGDISVDGTFRQPSIAGGLLIDNGSLLVDATGVEYTMTDSLEIANNHVYLRDFSIYDHKGNKALVTGSLDCTDFGNIRTDVNLTTANISVLNSNKGKAFYGDVYVAADASIKGPINALTINGAVKTNPGSEITVPISDQRKVKTQDYITFVSDQPKIEETIETITKEKSDSKLKVNATVMLTPDLKLELPIDFSQMMVDVNAAGEGQIQLTMDGGGMPSLVGDYEIKSGFMELTLIQLVSKKFTIEEGSLIQFPGALTDTRFDLRAIYSQRVNVSSLTGGLSSSDASQNRVMVNDIFAISGTIKSPEISFDIELPNADQSVQEEVFAYIDRSNERDMLNQSISLLVMGQFANASTANATEENTPNGYSLVASTLGSAVTSLVKVVNVDFDYKAANNITTEQYDLDISRYWNKFYFESSFGYGGVTHEFANTGGTSNLIGDMLIGWKLSQRIHLFMYNRTNTNDFTRTDLPYKQGLGLKFTRNFDNWGELFRRSHNKKKKK